MERFVSPPISELDHLRQPLTTGEKLVFEIFNTHLSPEWEIYIQPHLNGLRPDFVLLNPNVGIAIFEVKDWDLSAMTYKVKTTVGIPPMLYGVRDNEEISLQKQNPIEKIYRYYRDIFELYCPRLNTRTGHAVITAGVIFPFSDKESVCSLFLPSIQFRGMNLYPQYYPISGQNEIETGDILTIFPECKRHKSSIINEDLAKDLRNWLIEPEFSAAQRRPLELNENQRRIIRSRTKSGYRRIKGPAGSGKSVVLAARASELLNAGKQVLVVTFNITLTHYLMDLAVRWPHPANGTRKNITWLNFHSWCKRVCQEVDREDEYKKFWRKHFEKLEEIPNFEKIESTETTKALAEQLPEMIRNLIESDSGKNVAKYDAILVDEGQDFLPSWWNTLRLVLKDRGEMLLVADATQDIYETAKSWTDEAMIGAGFPGGRWLEFKYSYRMPDAAIDYARKFIELYLPKETSDVPLPPQRKIYPCYLKWVQTNKECAPEICQSEILKMPPLADPEILAITDIIFLTRARAFGRDVVAGLGRKGIKVVNTFDQDYQKCRRQKLGFYMGKSKIKATTLHSFKGWETHALVLYTGPYIDQRALALIYTGLTRIKQNPRGSYLTVVSSAPELCDYGRTWPKFTEIYQLQ